MRINIDIKGLEKLIEKFGDIPQSVEQEVDAAVEIVSLKMVNSARDAAPVDTSFLRNSIHIIEEETESMERVWGTNTTEYAGVQEYEHKTKSGFIRNSVRKHIPELEAEIAESINHALK